MKEVNEMKKYMVEILQTGDEISEFDTYEEAYKEVKRQIKDDMEEPYGSYEEHIKYSIKDTQTGESVYWE